MLPHYQLWHGDCLQEMDRIETGSVDMILADLPYQTTDMPWDTLVPFEPLWKQYKRVIKSHGAIVLFGSQPFTSLLVTSNFKWFSHEWIWSKSNGGGFLNANRQPLKRHENIIVFCEGWLRVYNPQKIKGKPYACTRAGVGATTSDLSVIGWTTVNNGDRYPTTVLEFSNEASNHETAKPTNLLRYLIRTYSNEGDLILDNCAGSGSTLEAAMRENRRSIGIELYPLSNKPIGNDNPDYFGIATKRLENVARELKGEWKPLHDTGGAFEGLPLLEGIEE